MRKSMADSQNKWRSVEHALAYLQRADSIPHRVEGEAALLDEIRPDVKRVLDLGTGDGRLLALVLTKVAGATGVAVDFSPAMLEKAASDFMVTAGCKSSRTTYRNRCPT
jgi:tRNA (cmo5U34)-methyltransferase